MSAQKHAVKSQSQSRRAGKLGRLLVLACATFLTLVSLSQAALAEMYSVRVRKARFRSGPTTKEPIKFFGAKYYPVKIISRKKKWVQIRDFEGEKAWILKRLLTKKYATAVIKVKKANVRTKPTIRSRVAFEVVRGEVFRVTKRRGHWLRIIDVNNEKGWILDKLVWGVEKPKKRR